MGSDKKHNDPEKDQAKEPEVEFGKKKITFFDSVEQMNESAIRSFANMTPKERLHTVYKMRNAIWPEQQSAKTFGKRIHIKK